MRTHYTGPTSTFYRCEESLSRLWAEALQHLETLHFQAVEAFTERHQDLLGEDGYLWENILWGPTIVAPTRPAGCRPHTHRLDPPMGGWAWLPDQRTRTGRMLADQIDGLPKLDPQMIKAAAPMPGNMPWTHQDETGTMLHFREVIDGLLYINWPVPIPGLDPAVWTPIDADEYAQAVAERKHRERVRTHLDAALLTASGQG